MAEPTGRRTIEADSSAELYIALRAKQMGGIREDAT
ncbi:hypothetical protein [Streptomyces malaysiensis]